MNFKQTLIQVDLIAQLVKALLWLLFYQRVRGFKSRARRPNFFKVTKILIIIIINHNSSRDNENIISRSVCSKFLRRI